MEILWMRYEEAEVGLPAEIVRRITDQTDGRKGALDVAVSLGLTPATQETRRVWTRTSGALVACESMSIETSDPDDVLEAPAFLKEAWPELGIGRLVVRGDRLAMLLFSHRAADGSGRSSVDGDGP